VVQESKARRGNKTPAETTALPLRPINQQPCPPTPKTENQNQNQNQNKQNDAQHNSFIPPDGAFDLMTYRLSLAIKPLVTLDVQVERPSRSRVEYSVRARSHYKERSTATNVEIALPLPADCTAPVCRASQGAAVYVPERSSLVWSVKQLPGGREITLRCHFNLPSVEADDGGASGGGGGGARGGGGGGGGGGLAARAGFAGARMPPAKVTLELPYYTASGLVVRYLRVVEKSGYQALPWVRYITSSTAEFRMI